MGHLAAMQSLTFTIDIQLYWYSLMQNADGKKTTLEKQMH